MFRKICFLKKGLTRSIDIGILYLVVEKQTHARVAQLVEHDLAKVGVAGSSPVSRSQRKQKDIHSWMSFCFSGAGGTRRFEVYAPLFGVLTA